MGDLYGVSDSWGQPGPGTTIWGVKQRRKDLSLSLCIYVCVSFHDLNKHAPTSLKIEVIKGNISVRSEKIGLQLQQMTCTMVNDGEGISP